MHHVLHADGTVVDEDVGDALMGPAHFGAETAVANVAVEEIVSTAHSANAALGTVELLLR